MAEEGVNITIDLDTAPMAKVFRRLVAAGADLAAPMADIAGHLEEETRHRFETGRDPVGAIWKPSRRAAEKGGKTLVERGRLRDSIVSRSDATSAEVGTNLEYAAIHQFGGKISREARVQTLYVNKVRAEGGDWRFVKSSKSDFAYDVNVGPYEINMTARPFIGLGDEDHRVIAYIIFEHLGRAAGADGVSA